MTTTIIIITVRITIGVTLVTMMMTTLTTYEDDNDVDNNDQNDGGDLIKTNPQEFIYYITLFLTTRSWNNLK